MSDISYQKFYDSVQARRREMEDKVNHFERLHELFQRPEWGDVREDLEHCLSQLLDDLMRVEDEQQRHYIQGRIYQTRLMLGYGKIEEKHARITRERLEKMPRLREPPARPSSQRDTR